MGIIPDWCLMPLVYPEFEMKPEWWLRFPLADWLMQTWRGGRHECWVLVWDQQRKDKGIPSIFD